MEGRKPARLGKRASASTGWGLRARTFSQAYLLRCCFGHVSSFRKRGDQSVVTHASIGFVARSRSAASPAVVAAACVLAERGVFDDRGGTGEGSQHFRAALEELGKTYIKLASLSSRPDLLPDVYIEELGRLVDEVVAAPPRP